MEQSWKRTPVRPCLAHSPASGSCVRLLKQLAAFKTPSGVNNFGFHSFFFKSQHIHVWVMCTEIEQHYSQPLPHIGFLCKEKVASVPPRIREMKTAADTEPACFDF